MQKGLADGCGGDLRPTSGPSRSANHFRFANAGEHASEGRLRSPARDRGCSHSSACHAARFRHRQHAIHDPHAVQFGNPVDQASGECNLRCLDRPINDGLPERPLFFGRLGCRRALDRLSEAMLEGIERIGLIRFDL